MKNGRGTGLDKIALEAIKGADEDKMAPKNLQLTSVDPKFPKIEENA